MAATQAREQISVRIPLLAGQARLRRLLFPVWANVDLVAAAAALGANDLATKVRHLGFGRVV
jgi:hypothetical protein